MLTSWVLTHVLSKISERVHTETSVIKGSGMYSYLTSDWSASDVRGCRLWLWKDLHSSSFSIFVFTVEFVSLILKEWGTLCWFLETGVEVNFETPVGFADDFAFPTGNAIVHCCLVNIRFIITSCSFGWMNRKEEWGSTKTIKPKGKTQTEKKIVAPAQIPKTGSTDHPAKGAFIFKSLYHVGVEFRKIQKNSIPP